jgi:alkylated DNA repair dioxygenase AlkB
MRQRELFTAPPRLPDGLVYRPDFLSADDEAELLARIAELPLAEARYKEFTAKRRIVSYGSQYDFGASELLPAPPPPEFLTPLRERIAAWTGIPAADLVHTLIAEYRPGTQLGWHRDVPNFEDVVGVSLTGACRLRFRPYPPVKGDVKRWVTLDVAPRSAYLLRGAARWRWQHGIPPTKELRYSITFRTASHRAGGAR